MTASLDDSAVAPRVPDFNLVRPIGAGGFGQVWLAINRTTGQPRAVKIVARARFGNRDPAGREIAALARLESNLRLSHPNLLAIHHVGQTDEHLFYVMDLADDLDGRSDPLGCDYRPATLDNRLQAGPLDAVGCWRCAEQLLSALACLHAAGMVHRDVKPANCLFLGKELKLGDFGLLTDAGPEVSQIGTLRYMPTDGRMDSQADVHAAGLVIYEMLTGLPAESFPSLGARVREVLDDPRLARLNRLALRACDPDRSRRYLDARQMLDELKSFEASPGKQRRGWRIFLAAGIAMAIALAVFLAWPASPVNVNFVTDPYEAVIYLDGRLLRAPDGRPYRTPCTIYGLSARPHHVQFRWDADSNLPSSILTGDGVDAGTINFQNNRQISLKQNAQ